MNINGKVENCAGVMAEQLAAHYTAFHKTARLPRSLDRRASAPLLVYPHDRWNIAKVKLLIVGQETLGWKYEPAIMGGATEAIRNFREFSASKAGVSAMWDTYRWYALGRQAPRRNSPFWRGFRLLDAAVNHELDSALWTNVFKVDVNGSVLKNCRAAEVKAIHAAQRDLLRKEIEVLRPDVAVFFTGPSHDPALRIAFPDLEYLPFTPDLPSSAIAQMIASGLPVKAVRVFHPVYLQRSNRWPLLRLISEWARA